MHLSTMSGQPLTGGPPPLPPFKTDVDFNENRQLEINLVAWICTAIAIAVVGLKLFAKARIVKVIGWDDFFIFFSMVSREGPFQKGATVTNRTRS